LHLIEKLYIENFKLIEENIFKFSRFNILIGPNGSGKSSVIHALAYIKIMARIGSEPRVPYEFPDLLFLRNISNREKSLKIEIHGKYLITFEELKGTFAEYIVRIVDMSFSGEILGVVLMDGKYVKEFPIKIGGKLLSRRSSSILEYVLKPGSSRIINIYAPIGRISFVPVLRGMVAIASQPAISLGYGYTNILGMIASDYVIRQKIGELASQILGYKVSLDLRFIRRGWALENLAYGIPINMAQEAFGISQLLYLLLFLLMTPEGGAVCIEEPEIHLHPASQARLVEKLVEVAKQRNLQLIITTHSEHILLKFLNLVAKNTITNEDLKVYYFERDEKKPVARVEELEVTEKGELIGGLKGFFEHEVDEFEEYIKARTSRR